MGLDFDRVEIDHGEELIPDPNELSLDHPQRGGAPAERGGNAGALELHLGLSQRDLPLLQPALGARDPFALRAYIRVLDLVVEQRELAEGRLRLCEPRPRPRYGQDVLRRVDLDQDLPASDPIALVHTQPGDAPLDLGPERRLAGGGGLRRRGDRDDQRVPHDLRALHGDRDGGREGAGRRDALGSAFGHLRHGGAAVGLVVALYSDVDAARQREYHHDGGGYAKDLAYRHRPYPCFSVFANGAPLDGVILNNMAQEGSPGLAH